MQPCQQATIYAISPKTGITCPPNRLYVGSTARRLGQRLAEHKKDYKRHCIGLGTRCSSFQLFEEYGIDNLQIVEIEKCDMAIRKERERYWIREMDSVNERRLDFNTQQFMRNYYITNRDRLRRKARENYLKRKEARNQLAPEE
jgi:hypothetical protein